MIIDAHCHIWEEKLMSAEMRRIIDAVAERFKPQYPDQLSNGTIERLLGEMDEAGIDKTVLLALDAGLAFPSHLTVRDYNDYVADIVKRHPDRIIGFAGIDPRRGKEALVELDRCADIGLRGLKLWTLTGFYPDDERYYPLYERAAELKMPIVVHTGTGPPGTYLKFNRPVYVDKMAVDFPEIPIIMAHLGMPWIDEAVAIVIKNPNVYVDISQWQVFSKTPFVLCQALTQLKIGCGGMHKVLFGSDWPLLTPLLSHKEWVNYIKELSMAPPLQMMGLKDFTEKDKTQLLGANAERILNLKN
ncbi:MAG: amidohydrolase [Candidatus Abyssobacteria bacterium SURF_5]|uniref:Amidohydrolase n=1 Tax=Abyssobacteria bacterium (strain SURF_5) TaxID=2093360 RepID=A0A3A4N6F8_ABYX5|nr:MAG: amidohydrolase [Candidatus Abyssubacteria bacterium SURF_5]